MRHGEHEHGPDSVLYRFQPAKDDRQHLIVIFSGFRKFGTFDLGGSTATSLRANVLWIEDRFNEKFAYYLLQNGDSWVEDAVYSLIEKTRTSLALEKFQTSIVGFSKGGSAALYYGLKYGYANILSTVPQFKIGTYVKEYWPKVHESLLGTITETGTAELDAILPALVKKRQSKDANVYLFSSPEDAQHETQVAPFIKYFRKYQNFNYIETRSPMVREHDKVTRYNVPLILSLLSIFTENISPKIGYAQNGSNSIGTRTNQDLSLPEKGVDEVANNIDKLTISDGRLFIEGFAFTRGHEATNYNSINAIANFTNSNSNYAFELASAINRDLSYSQFSKKYCDYTYAGFTTFDHRGIDLTGISNGIFELKFEVAHDSTKNTVDAVSKRKIDVWGISGNSVVHVKSSPDGAALIKRPVLHSHPPDAYIELTNSWAKESTLHLEGFFVVPGAPAAGYSTTSFYLVLTKPQTDSPIHVFNLATGNRLNAGTKINDPWIDYSKAYFATPKYKGIDLANTTPGKYDCWITARYGESLFSAKIQVGLNVGITYSHCGDATLPTVGVIGSCVSRDNFSSRVVPDWKHFFRFHGNQYQMSLLSLMSPPLDIDNNAFSDVDVHTANSTIRDFRKSYLQELQASQPSIIVVDLRADARFGCITVGDSLVTNNEWKLHLTEFYRSLNDVIIYSMANDSIEYLSLFEKAAQEFELFRNEFLPNTKIVLNSARGVSSRLEQGRRVIFSKSVNKRLNEYWDTLDEVFLRNVSVDSVFTMPSFIQADSNHAWGPGPLHYEKRYYDEFRSWILSVMSGATTVQCIKSQAIRS